MMRDLDTVICLGDGKGGFCSSTKLRDEEYVMQGKRYLVWEFICSNTSLINAEIHECSNWDDQERILLQLIARIIYCGRVPFSLISNHHHLEAISVLTSIPLELV
ncbi:3'(2'),5'-bisphosphate nucleotidase [Ranunculus cassubicifolius]